MDLLGKFSKEAIADRLNKAATARGLVDRKGDTDIPKISEITKLAPRTLHNYFKGEQRPGSEPLGKFNEQLGFNLNYIVAGNGTPLNNAGESGACFELEVIKDGRNANQVRENIETIAFPAWADISNDCIVFRVGDDSMINVGIGTGCMVVVKPEEKIQSGSIALVDLWGAYTVKHYFCSSKGEVMLKPANTSHVETRFNIEESADIKPIGSVVAAYKIFSGDY